MVKQQGKLCCSTKRFVLLLIKIKTKFLVYSKRKSCFYNKILLWLNVVNICGYKEIFCSQNISLMFKYFSISKDIGWLSLYFNCNKILWVNGLTVSRMIANILSIVRQWRQIYQWHLILFYCIIIVITLDNSRIIFIVANLREDWTSNI